MEDNKLIAEFMGFQHTTLGWYDAEETLVNVEKDNTFDELKFHSDWNWLIDVVEKIYEMDLYYDKYIDYNSRMFSSGKIKLGTRIEGVYEQVVNFIKWYNEQK